MLILTRQENKISWFYEAQGFDGVVSMNNYRHEEVKVSRECPFSFTISCHLTNIWALLHWGCTPINIRFRVTSYLEKYEKHWTWISIYVTHPTTEILMTHWLTVHVTHPWSSKWTVQKDFLSPSSRCKLPLPLLINTHTHTHTQNFVPWNLTLPGNKEGKFLVIVMLMIRILKAEHNTEAQNLFKIQNVCSGTRRGVSTYIYVPFLQGESWGRERWLSP